MIVSTESMLSVYILMFWFSRDISGRVLSVFSPANDNTQVRLGVDKTQQMVAVQSGKKCRRGQGREEKEI